MNARLIFAIVSCVAAGCIGMRYAARMNADTARLADWLSLLDRLHLAVSRGHLSLPDALEAAADTCAAPDVLLRSLAAELREHPTSTLHELSQRKRTPALQEASVIGRLTASLDRGSLECRLLAIEQAQEAIRLLHELQTARSRRDAPMWTRLGWTAGACLMIMLL